MNYYSGGPDEFILALPKNKRHYFLNLLTTNSSLGIAMEILGLPHIKSDKKLVEIVQDKVLTNANAEEEIFYKDTLFRYKYISSQKPQLVFSAKKLFNLTNILNTIKILISQARWIANIDKIIMGLWQKISEFSKRRNISFEKEVFPHVIVIGYLNEYFSQIAVQGKDISEQLEINSQIDSQKTLTDKQLIVIRELRKLRSQAQKLSFLLSK